MPAVGGPSTARRHPGHGCDTPPLSGRCGGRRTFTGVDVWSVRAGLTRATNLINVLGDDSNDLDNCRYFEWMASLHPLQPALDRLPQHLQDAQQLHGLTRRQLDELTARRRVARGNGGGPPPLEHKTLNRAIILAAVGAWEAYVEDLAEYAADASTSSAALSSRRGWFPSKGSSSMVQTPSPNNVRKLLWGLFAYDPMADWSIVVTTNGNELTPGGGTWRGRTHTHHGKDACDFLQATVNVRHAFAHQDRAKKIASVVGMAQERAGGGSNVGSHHAENAVSAVLQLAVLTNHGLARHLKLGERFRYKKSMQEQRGLSAPGIASWAVWLEDTPALAAIKAHWVGAP